MNKCISTNQKGFMPKRFIGEQGMIVHCLQELASNTRSDDIALLLDQQKAYDRVHFDYLQQCMQAFNIPDIIFSAVISLFSSTMILVNVNGFLTESFQQHRGLRQGDPISPLLFNIALHPLLRTIDSSEIQGFDLSKISNSSSTRSPSAPPPTTTNPMPPGQVKHIFLPTDIPPPVKVIAYADDPLVTQPPGGFPPTSNHLLQVYECL